MTLFSTRVNKSSVGKLVYSKDISLRTLPSNGNAGRTYNATIELNIYPDKLLPEMNDLQKYIMSHEEQALELPEFIGKLHEEITATLDPKGLRVIGSSSSLGHNAVKYLREYYKS